MSDQRPVDAETRPPFSFAFQATERGGQGLTVSIIKVVSSEPVLVEYGRTVPDQSTPSGWRALEFENRYSDWPDASSFVIDAAVGEIVWVRAEMGSESATRFLVDRGGGRTFSSDDLRATSGAIGEVVELPDNEFVPSVRFDEAKFDEAVIVSEEASRSDKTAEGHEFGRGSGRLTTDGNRRVTSTGAVRRVRQPGSSTDYVVDSEAGRPFSSESSRSTASSLDEVVEVLEERDLGLAAESPPRLTSISAPVSPGLVRVKWTTDGRVRIGGRWEIEIREQTGSSGTFRASRSADPDTSEASFSLPSGDRAYEAAVSWIDDAGAKSAGLEIPFRSALTETKNEDLDRLDPLGSERPTEPQRVRVVLDADGSKQVDWDGDDPNTRWLVEVSGIDTPARSRPDLRTKRDPRPVVFQDRDGAGKEWSVSVAGEHQRSTILSKVKTVQVSLSDDAGRVDLSRSFAEQLNLLRNHTIDEGLARQRLEPLLGNVRTQYESGAWESEPQLQDDVLVALNYLEEQVRRGDVDTEAKVLTFQGFVAQLVDALAAIAPADIGSQISEAARRFAAMDSDADGETAAALMDDLADGISIDADAVAAADLDDATKEFLTEHGEHIGRAVIAEISGMQNRNGLTLATNLFGLTGGLWTTLYFMGYVTIPGVAPVALSLLFVLTLLIFRNDA